MRNNLVAAALIDSLMMAESAAPLSPPRAGDGQRRKPTPPPVKKVPTTPYDFARLEAAERKRARKAAKLRALQPQGPTHV